MFSRLMKTSCYAAIGVASVAVMGSGCSEKKEQPVPMSSRHDSTSETGMSEPVALDQLNEMIDEAAQYLVREMPNIPAVKSSKNQMVFAVPPSFEHDSRIPDGRLRVALEALKAKLQENETFNSNFVVISGTQSENNKTLNQVAGSDTSSFRDPLQRKADQTKSATYDPTSVYTLTGKFYQMNDPGPGLKDYRLFIKVSHPQSRQEILKYEFHRQLKWDADNGKWKVTT